MLSANPHNNQKPELPSSVAPILLPSDSDEEFCQCGEGCKQCEALKQCKKDDGKESCTDNTVLSSSDNTAADTDSDFHASDCDFDTESTEINSSGTLSKYEEIEEDKPLEISMKASVDRDSRFLRRRRQTIKTTNSIESHQKKSKEVSSSLILNFV